MAARVPLRADASCEGAGRLFVFWLTLPPAPLTPMSSGPCLTRGRLFSPMSHEHAFIVLAFSMALVALGLAAAVVTIMGES